MDKIKLKINGRTKEISINPGDILLDVLRREGYYGVKKGCSEGSCGACTILFNGRPTNSCLLLAYEADDSEITTISGIGTMDNPHPIQKAFVKSAAVQCGFCTPGMIISTKHLLDTNQNPDEEDIKQALDGNFCRCTGYVKIIDAVKLAAEYLKEEE